MNILDGSSLIVSEMCCNCKNYGADGYCDTVEANMNAHDSGCPYFDEE